MIPLILAILLSCNTTVMERKCHLGYKIHTDTQYFTTNTLIVKNEKEVIATPVRKNKINHKKEIKKQVKKEQIKPKRTLITVYGASWCSSCKHLLTILAKENIDYIYVDIEKQRVPTSLAPYIEKGIPVVSYPDGSVDRGNKIRQ